MIRQTLAATALLLAAVPAAAQNQQEALDARYDRALAAGYKALMLCGAITSAEANGAARTPESVMQWELTGIQAPQASVIADLPFTIIRSPDGLIARVAVSWAEDMPARIAIYGGPGNGCALAPIGSDDGAGDPRPPVKVAPRFEPKVLGTVELPMIEVWKPPPPTALDRAFEVAFGEGYGKGRSTAVLVNRYDREGRRTEGRARYKSGFDDRTPQRTFSVAKSIAATLIGAAVYRGEVDVNASAGLGLAENDPRRAITIDHLLRMASGRYSDRPGNRTDPLYYGGATVDEVALDWPLVSPPGSTYRYANNDTLAAVAAIKGTFAAHPPAELFARLGMEGTVAETDWRGDYILSSQVWATADDLAKLGQLYLNDGKLPSGERILPEGWVKYVTTPSGPQPPTGTFGYGAGFWLLNKEEGVPPDTFAAIGNRGQYVVIVPSRQVVIVRRGEDPAGSGFDIAAFTRDVLAALAAE
ncbi:serine hydrolase domain-containing protein [Erythrobacter oryzae]|uniref:serine hydrolase domain-containing protein n=1 Tax=Erythrobacter oryzae TaxID=3019556 RepID=UPI002554DE6D|nr:serine hydrolase [Erythrobacter sp. COR-2]